MSLYGGSPIYSENAARPSPSHRSSTTSSQAEPDGLPSPTTERGGQRNDITTSRSASPPPDNRDSKDIALTQPRKGRKADQLQFQRQRQQVQVPTGTQKQGQKGTVDTRSEEQKRLDSIDGDDEKGSLRIRIELDLDVEVHLTARVKGDITIGLL